MPCPMALTAENTSITPSACTETVTRSSNTLPPVHSRKVAMPSPRWRPLRADSAARPSKPFQSARPSAWSITDSNLPVS